jgi:hypothetical protein
MRYKTPDFVSEYYNRNPPKCCHTCEHFIIVDARCMKFEQQVPEDFAQSIEVCEQWSELIVPF